MVFKCHDDHGLRNVRYANNSPVYNSISLFDRALEMACSISDSATAFLSYRLFKRHTTIKG